MLHRNEIRPFLNNVINYYISVCDREVCDRKHIE